MRTKALAGALLALLLLSIVPASGARTRAEQDAGYAACFDFASLVRGGTVRPHWMEDGRHLWYARGSAEEREILRVDLASGMSTPFFDVSRLRRALRESLGVEPEGTGVPFATFELRDEGSVARFELGERNFELRLEDHVLTELPSPEAPASEPDETERLPSPDGRRVAVIRDHDLWLESADGSQPPRRVTHDGSESTPWYGYGALWSPDGRTLAIQRWDLRPVPTIPLVDWLDPMAPVTRDPYSHANQPRIQGTVHRVDAERGTLMALDLPLDDEPFFHAAGWIPESGELLLIRFDRPMQKQDLLAVDPTTGTTRVLLHEETDTFLDGLAAYSLLDRYLHPLDETGFLWLSQRNGWHQLHRVRYDGTVEGALTPEGLEVLGVERVDLEGDWIYLMAQPDPGDPFGRHLCRVRRDGSGFARLTEGPGRHRVSIAPDLSCFVDNHSDADRPPRAELRRIDGDLIRVLETADVSRVEALGWTPPERVVVKAADGVSDAYCAIYRPPGFDPSRSYPVIEMIYAGPQWTIVPHRYVAGEYGDNAAAFAQLGYVAVIVDTPGTAGRGKAYQDAVYGKLGQIEIPDHVAALKNLAATRPWMDLERVGVHGKSWGGYFALRAMLLAPEFYDVGVASAAVADLATTAESPVVPYLGLPRDNPEGYAAADCLPLADRLAGKLLITTGTGDQNTPFGQSMRMLEAFIQAEKDVEILVLPGQHHWLQGASYRRWQRAMRDFFREHLPPVAPSRPD